MTATYSLVLIDDHAVVRQGLATLIEALGPYEIVAQFGNGSEFLDVVPLAPPPDLLLLDLQMPVMNGRETMRHLAARGMKYPVLVLTNEVDTGNVLELVTLGARGYLSKGCSATELREALSAILAEGYYHSELEQLALRGERRSRPNTPALSPRETEFLRLACSTEEYTYRAIAQMMGVSERTVDGYREELFRKAGVKSKVGLVFYALRHSLVELPVF